MSGGHITGYYALHSIAEEIERLAIEQPELGPDVLGRYRLAAEHARRAYEAIRAVDYLESGDYGRESFVAAWDALVVDPASALRADVQRLQRERDAAIDERNAWRSGDQDSRIEADRLRGEVQRLTAWVQQAGLPSIPVAMAPDGIASIRVENYKVERIGDRNLVWVDADEVRRLLPLTAEARRSDAGRVEVEPSEIDAAWNDYATLNSAMLSDDPDDDLEVFSAGFRAGASRLSTSPQPATGAALTCDDCDSREGCPKRGTPCMYHVSHSDHQPSADVVVPREDQLLREVGELTLAIRSAEDAGIPNTRAYVEANDKRHKLLDELDALRSSTNHDAQDDRGEGR